MENYTVNKKSKPQHIEGAAGKGEETITTAIALQNNKPHKLQLEVTNSEAVKDLPFMIENGDFVAENDEYVVARAKGITREAFEAMKKAKKAEEKSKEGETEGR